jgi:hypothetical protein
VQAATWLGERLDVRSDAVDPHLAHDLVRIPRKLDVERTILGFRSAKHNIGTILFGRPRHIMMDL